MQWEVVATGAGIAIAICGSIIGVAWKAGLFRGQMELRSESTNHDIERIEENISRVHDRLSAMRTELTQMIEALEARIQKLHDLALVNQNDIEHLRQFRAELRDALRDLERNMRDVRDSKIARFARGGSPNDAS